MKIPKSILIVSLAALAILSGLWFARGWGKTPTSSVLVSQDAADLQPVSNSEGGVEVTVTPSWRETAWDFEISLNTHSVELDNDLVRDSFLADESGRKYSPNSWEGDPPGGHHREGILRFDQKIPGSNLKLVVRNLGVPERSFEWRFP